MSMLKVSNLTAGYKGGFHISDINLEIKKEDFAGIIGPNGSGKTTLLKAFTRVLKPETGKILFNSADMKDLSFRDMAKNFAVVPQTAETGFVTVGDYVLLGRLPYYGRFQLFEGKRDREIADEYMELTGVSGLKDKLMGEISGGERQLAAIARALAQEPKILLLDEPTSHLDIKHQVEILDLLKKMNSERGITVVCVLHDLNLAGEYCSVLMLMDKGKLYKSGGPREVLAYEIIEKVYDTVVIVMENPVSGKPFVVTVSGEEREKTGKINR